MKKAKSAKILSLFLSLIMAFSAMNVAIITADAAGAIMYSGDYSYRKLSDGTIEIAEYRGSSETVSIPETIDGTTVTSIGASAFFGNDNVKSVVVPSDVTNIGEDAFRFCTSLQSVVLNEGLVTVGDQAFGSCKSLSSIYIPSSVDSLNRYTFFECSSLPAFNVSSSNPYFTAVDGILYDKDVTELIDCPDGKVGSVTVPNTITKIRESTFSNCKKITDVTLPSSVKQIGSFSFSRCESLESITLNDGLELISDYSFNGCVKLTSITIPASVIDAGQLVFLDCQSLQSINVDSANKYYCSMNGILYNKALTSVLCCPPGYKQTVILPSCVEKVATYAFHECKNVPSITLSSSLQEIGYWSFYSCDSLYSITIPSNVTSIDTYAFSHCYSLEYINVSSDNATFSSNSGVLYSKDQTKLVIFPQGKTSASCIPSTVTTIGSSAFQGCSKLTDAYIPYSVKVIENFAFVECDSLTSVYIPNGVTEIGNLAFYDCDELYDITIPASVTTIDDNVFYGCPEFVAIYGYKGTTAESYAEENGHTFIALDDMPDYLLADVDNSGEINLLDVTTLQKHLADKSNTIIIRSKGDVDADGEVSSADATFIQRWCVNIDIPYQLGNKGVG